MAGKPKVFVTRRLPAAGLDRILAACDAEVWPEPLPPPHELLLRTAAGCDGLVTLLTDRIDAGLLDAAPRLKVVSNYAVGFNNVDVAAATARGVVVGNTPGVLTDATADMAFCLLIAAAGQPAAETAEPGGGAAHRQRHLRHAQRHGRDLRQ